MKIVYSLSSVALWWLYYFSSFCIIIYKCEKKFKQSLNYMKKQVTADD